MVTPHNHTVVFGRTVEGCARCAELRAGAKPVQWKISQRKADEIATIKAIRSHVCDATCGTVCTRFSW